MRIIVHSKTDCPWCGKAKAFLLEQRLPFKEIVHDDAEERQQLYDGLGLVGMERTVPQIVVVDDDGEEMRVGGWDKLVVSGIASLGVLGLGGNAIGLEGAQEIHARRIAAREEPVFMLRAMDRFAPELVQLWIDKTLPALGERHPKIVSARNRLQEIHAWQEIHGAKHPD